MEILRPLAELALTLIREVILVVVRHKVEAVAEKWHQPKHLGQAESQQEGDSGGSEADIDN